MYVSRSGAYGRVSRRFNGMRTSNSWPPERLQKSELSMIRRVKEDALLVDLDVYSHSSQYASVNSWMDPHRSMLEHHENDAKRVRESVCGLQQC